MVLFTLIVFGAGWAIGYIVNGDMYSGMIITAIVLVFYVPISYYSSSKQVLAMSGAKRITHDDHPELFNIVAELVIPARLPMPKIYIIHDPAPNAFATGINPEQASVAVTTGLLEILNREEMEGVIAHELGHIQNYDIRLMTVSISLVSVIVLIAEFGSRLVFFGGNRNRDNNRNPYLMIVAIVFVILAPLAGSAVRMAVSRNREYLADASAVKLTRNPQGLQQALAKIGSVDLDVKNAKDATAGMYISNPFAKRQKTRKHVWATHPPIEERIERLSNM